MKDIFPDNNTEVEILEKRVIKRITMKNFISNILEAFNLTRGGIYTVKRLLINPGKTAKDYLGLNRYSLTAPISLLIITTTIALLLLNQVDFIARFLENFINVNEQEIQLMMKEETIKVYATFFNLLLWTFAPIIALFTFLFNMKKGFNYAENLVFHAYNLTLFNLLLIITFPLILIFKSASLVNIVLLITLAYVSYAYKMFFNKQWWRSFLEVFLTFIVSIFLWSLLNTGAIILVVHYIMSQMGAELAL